MQKKQKMHKFLLSLFIFINLVLYDIRIGWNAFYMYVTNLLLKFLSYILLSIKSFFKRIWTLLKWVTWPFRKMSYHYVFIIFFACLFITIKYPEWKWTDYTWLVFFFTLMLYLLISTLTDKS